MTNDDIAKKLALLPKGIAESNLRSWDDVVSFYKFQIDHPISDILPDNFHDKALSAMYGLAKDFAKTAQAKLFRGGTSINDLFISTADKHGLKVGDRFVRVTFTASKIIIQCEIGSPITLDEDPNVIKRVSCEANDNLMSAIQPLLNLLWDETRGKKNA